MDDRRLRAVPLFADLPEEDLARLAAAVEEVTLDVGDLLFSEGESGDRAYVIVDGELDVVKITGSREVLLARRGPGDVIGEMALLDAAPRMASVRAATGVRLLSIPKRSMDELIASSASAARSLFSVLLERWRQTESRLRQSERMAQLGTLTAGLAHEMNNPAAAIRRGSSQLQAAVDAYAQAVSHLESAGLDGASKGRIGTLLRAAAQPAPPIGSLELADREAELEAALTRAGIADPWRIAGDLAAGGLTVAEVDEIQAGFGEASGAVFAAVAAARHVHALIREVEEGAVRLSAIVGALKSYSYLDQAPVQHVDVRKGLTDTLLILRHKLAGIDVRIELDEVPEIEAFGSELNQVWTNLIDNAADAIAESGRPDGMMVLRAFARNDAVVVEVEDNGVGIPGDDQKRIFDPFFTTKPPGSGTGLGLDISYAVVVHKHRGELTVDSEPGRTVFRVSLPTGGLDATV